MLIDALVRDALALLEVVSTFELDEQAARTVALLALIAGQDVEPAQGSDGTDGRWQIVRKVAKDRVISVVDPDARHAHKTVSRKQDGFKAHLAVEPDTGIVASCKLTKAAGAEAADGTVGVSLPGRDDSVTEPVEVLGDSAYGTGQALDELDKTGHIPLVKPSPTRPTVAGGFNLDDSTVDEDAGTVTCPDGTVRPISPKRNVTFGIACRDCEAPTANELKTRNGRRSTASTDRWSNAPSPGWSPAATARSATRGVTTEPGPWPKSPDPARTRPRPGPGPPSAAAERPLDRVAPLQQR